MAAAGKPGGSEPKPPAKPGGGTDGLAGRIAGHEPAQQKAADKTTDVANRMPSTGSLQTPGAARRGHSETPQRAAKSRPRIKDAKGGLAAAQKALPGKNTKIAKPAKLGAKAVKRAKQAGSAAGRQQIRNDAREGIKEAGKKAVAEAKRRAKQVAKKAAKEAVKHSAKAAWQALVACVASVVCGVILGVAVLLLAILGAVGLQVMFTGGVNIDLNEMVEEQRAARVAAADADGTGDGRERIADLGLLEAQWRLGGDDGTSPVGVLKRWTSAEAGPTYKLTTVQTHNDRELACDRLLDGYAAEQDLATVEEIREEIDEVLSDTDDDICVEMWTAAVAWTHTLRAAAANIDGIDFDNLADLDLADLDLSGYPIRDVLQAITLADSELAPYHTTSESSDRVAMTIALWAASGFATSDPTDGFVELYYAPRQASDKEAISRYRRGGRTDVLATTTDLITRAEGRAAHRVDQHRSRAEATWVDHYQHIADLRDALIAAYEAGVAEAEENGTAPPPYPILPPFPPSWTASWPTYCGDPGGLYGRAAVVTDSQAARTTTDRTVAAVDTDKVLMPVECPLPATVDVCRRYPKGAAVPEFASSDPFATAAWCVDILRIENEFLAVLAEEGHFGLSYLLWHEKWERNGTAGYTIGSCTPANTTSAPQDAWVVSFCADLLHVTSDGHSHLVRGFGQTEWAGSPPAPAPPEFGQLLALFVDWESNTSHNVPAAQRAFAMANLRGWVPPFGVPGASRSAFTDGDPGRLGCPRLWRVVTFAAQRTAGAPTDADSIDEACDGPTETQMNQWGWTHPYESACPRPEPLTQHGADDVDIVDLAVSLRGTERHILQVAPCMVPALQRMYDLLAKHRIRLAAVSTYRDWEDQAAKYAGFVAAGGVEAGVPPVAVPGYSRHNMGLAIDFACNIATSSDGVDLMPECWRWLDYYGFYYGLVNLPVEEWHWSADGR